MFFCTLFFFNTREGSAYTSMDSSSGPGHTLYYNRKGVMLGASHTTMKSSSGPCITTYYDQMEKEIGTSISRMHSASGPCETSYYNNKKKKIGTSNTIMDSLSGPCRTNYYNNKKEMIGTSSTSLKNFYGVFKTEFHFVSLSSVAHIEDKNVFIKQLKSYYQSQAGMFNASRKVFNSTRVDEIIENLQTRALNNPDGASKKTMKYFNLT
jgi:hypothetical protein